MRGGKREKDRPCQISPRDKQHHLVKPVPGSHRQMLCFFYDNGRPAKQLAASRSFEQLLTSKLSLAFTPTLVPARHARSGRGLVASSFNAGVDVLIRLVIKCLNVLNVFVSPLRVRASHGASLKFLVTNYVFRPFKTRSPAGASWH